MKTVQGPVTDAECDSRQSLLYAKDLVDVYRRERERRRELECANRKLETLIASMDDGMAVTDGQGRVTEANPALCAMVDKKLEDVVGAPLSKLLGVQGLQSVASGVSRLEVRPDAHHRRSYSVAVSPLHNQADETLYVFRDITALQRMHELAVDFLALVSHELRTPLNGIQGFSGLLREALAEDDRENREMVEHLKNSADRMERIVNELLHFAELQHERRQDPEEEVRLPDVVRSVLDDLADEAAEAGVRMRMRNLYTEPVCIRGWSHMVREMIYHVVRNGLVHGAAGRIVSVRLRRNEEGAEVEVMDKGQGIPPGELERVFEGFYQVEGHMNHGREGLGLGLAMVKRIADVHGARVRLRSAPGKGATVRITFPPYRCLEDTGEAV